jgi:hypothetical protein
MVPFHWKDGSTVRRVGDIGPGSLSFHTRYIMRIGARLLWPLFLSLCAVPAASQTESLHRVATQQLLIPLRGVAVIRDSVAWHLLWRRYEERAYRDGRVVHAAVPSIDFRTEMLVAVALGPTSGCSNEAHNIGDIVERPDSIIIVIGSADEGEPLVQLTCAMEIEPVDVVRLNRSSKPVAFHSYQAGIPTPPPATWWRRPSPAELDRMGESERGVFMSVLARDPATPLPTLVTIVGRLPVGEGEIARDLLRRSDVLASTELLIALARWDQQGGSRGREAKDELFARHGTALAGDPSTPSDVLGMLIEQLRGQWTPRHQEVARLLARNPTVQGKDELLRQFIFLTQNRRDVSGEACKVYVARWISRENPAPTMKYLCSQVLLPEPSSVDGVRLH